MITRTGQKPSSYDFRFSNVRLRGRWIAGLERQAAGREAMTWLRALASVSIRPGRRAMVLKCIEPVVQKVNGGLADRWRDGTEPGWVPQRLASLAVEFHFLMAEQYLHIATDSVFHRRAYSRAFTHCGNGIRVSAENYMDPPDTLWSLIHRIYEAAGGASASTSLQCQYRRLLVMAVTDTAQLAPREIHALYRVLYDCSSFTRLVPLASSPDRSANNPKVFVNKHSSGYPRLVHGSAPDGTENDVVYDLTPLVSAWMTMPTRRRILSDAVSKQIHDAWCDGHAVIQHVAPDEPQHYSEHLVAGLTPIIRAMNDRESVACTEGRLLTVPGTHMQWSWPMNGKRLAIGMPLAHRSDNGGWTVLIVRCLKRVGHTLHVGTETLRGAPTVVRVGTFGKTAIMRALQVGSGRVIDLLLPDNSGIHGLREVLVLSDNGAGYFKVVRLTDWSTGGIVRVSIDSGRDSTASDFDYRAALAAL